MRCSFQVHEGVIDGGLWVVGGQTFRSPSGAASGVARTKKRDPVKLDGWLYWEVLMPTETEWTRLRDLRLAARKRRGHYTEELLDFLR